MKYEVTRTHEQGRRLREGEQLERAQGVLTIEPYPSKNKGGLPRLAATLWVLEPQGHRRGVLSPLFEPRAIGLDADGVLRLAGVEINSDSSSSEIFDCVQVWECRPVDGRRRPSGQNRPAGSEA